MRGRFQPAGWSAGLISVAVTVYYSLSAGCLVVVGGLIDRHAPRGVLTYGVVTMAAAVALRPGRRGDAGRRRAGPGPDGAAARRARELSDDP